QVEEGTTVDVDGSPWPRHRLVVGEDHAVQGGGPAHQQSAPGGGAAPPGDGEARHGQGRGEGAEDAEVGRGGRVAADGQVVRPGAGDGQPPPAAVICGRADSSEIVCGVANVPAVSKVMVSAVVAVLASMIAWRKLPVPESLMLVTRKFAGARRSSRASRSSRRFRLTACGADSFLAGTG